MSVEMRDVAAGLWLWRQPHPDWREGSDWEPEVASFAVESRAPASCSTRSRHRLECATSGRASRRSDRLRVRPR